jgi:5-hydroxyisourate hydrolase
VPGVSIHVVDVARGVVATGMEVELHAIDAGGKLELVAKGRVGANGLLNAPELSKTFAAGGYVAVFHVAGFYRAQGVPLPAVPFLDVVRFHFGISDPAQHYHLPFKCTPWGYSCFRGGA